MTGSASIAGYVPDLMDRSRFGALDIDFVASPDALVNHEARTVVLDLGRPGVLTVLAELADRRIIGFASHVDTDLIQSARDAGCHEVLPRSRFFARISETLGEGVAPDDS